MASAIVKTKNSRLVMGVIVIVAAIAADQALKRLMYVWLRPLGTFPLIEGFIHLFYTTNTGAAFGIFSNHRWVFLVISTVAILLMIGIMAVYGRRSTMLTLSLALLAGGGIGNMIDRIVHGYVIDFAEFQFVHFAIFNFADTCVTIGSGLLILYILIFELFKKRPAAAAEPAAEPTPTEHGGTDV